MLATQTIDIPLQGGLTELVDSRLVPIGSWLTLKNCRKNKVAGFGKRYGTTPVSRDSIANSNGAITTGSISACTALGQLAGTLLLSDGDHVYQRDEIANRWADKSVRANSATIVTAAKLAITNKMAFTSADRIKTLDWCQMPDGTICAVAETVDLTNTHALYDIVLSSSGDLLFGPTFICEGRAPKLILAGTTAVLTYMRPATDALTQQLGSGLNITHLFVQGDRLHWTDTAAGTIVQGRLDENATRTLATFQLSPQGIVTDNDNVYWVTATDGKLWKMPRTGGTAPIALAQTKGSGTAPSNLILSGNKLYWSVAGSQGGIYSILTTGGPVNLYAAGQSPEFFAIDAISLYYARYNDNTLHQVALTDGTDFSWPAGGTVSGITVDSAYIYWAWTDGINSYVSKTPIGVNSAVVLFTALTITLIRKIVVDEFSGVLYAAMGTQIVKMDLGSAPPCSYRLQTIIVAGSIVDFAINGNYIYYADGTKVYRSKLDISATLLYTMPGQKADDLLVDANNLYWLDKQNDFVYHALKDGTGAMLTYGTSPDTTLKSLAQNTTRLFWASNTHFSSISKLGAGFNSSPVPVFSAIQIRANDNFVWLSIDTGAPGRAILRQTVDFLDTKTCASSASTLDRYSLSLNNELTTLFFSGTPDHALYKTGQIAEQSSVQPDANITKAFFPVNNNKFLFCYSDLGIQRLTLSTVEILNLGSLGSTPAWAVGDADIFALNKQQLFSSYVGNSVIAPNAGALFVVDQTGGPISVLSSLSTQKAHAPCTDDRYLYYIVSTGSDVLGWNAKIYRLDMISELVFGGKLFLRNKASATAPYINETQVTANLQVAETEYAWDSSSNGTTFYVGFEENIPAPAFTVKKYDASLTLLSTIALPADLQTRIKKLTLAQGGIANSFFIGFSFLDSKDRAAITARYYVEGMGFGALNTIFTGETDNLGILGKVSIKSTGSTTAKIALSYANAIPDAAGTFLTDVSVDNTTLAISAQPPTAISGYQLISEIFVAPDAKQYCYVRDISQLTAQLTLPGTLCLLDVTNYLYSRIVARDFSRQLLNDNTEFLAEARLSVPVVYNAVVQMFVPVLAQFKTRQYPVSASVTAFNMAKVQKFVGYGKVSYLTPGQVFDGNSVSELGFHTIPNAPNLIQNGSMSSGLSAGKYAWCAVYRKMNAAGEILRSSPGAASELTVTAGAMCSVSLYAHILTDKQEKDFTSGIPNNDNIVVEFYRTLANGQTFYLLSEQPLNLHALTLDSAIVAISDGVPDTVLSGQPILYTAAQATNFSPPNLYGLVVWNNRLCGIGTDGKTIWISNEHVSGYQPYFNETFNVTTAVDKLTALGVLDDKLIAFTANSAYLITGSPANGLGADNTLIPVSISADLGCIDERSLVAAGDGLLFQTRRSIGRLTRQLEISELGQAVQQTLASNPVVAAAAYHEKDREARFAVKATESSATGALLVFDLNTQTWFTNTFYDSVALQAATAFVASQVVSGIWYGACSNGNVLKETQTSYLDSGQYVPLEFITPWIHFASTANMRDVKFTNIGDFQRVRHAILQGEKLTSHDLAIDISKDFKDSVIQTQTWPAAELAVLPGAPMEDVNVHLAQQKCKAIRIGIRDVAPTSGVLGTGQGPVFYSLVLQLGMKQGLGKTESAAQRK